MLVRAAARVRSNTVRKHEKRKGGGSSLTFYEACHEGDVSCSCLAGKGTWVGDLATVGSSPLLDRYILASRGGDGGAEMLASPRGVLASP